jgi:hypothetical protein
VTVRDRIAAFAPEDGFWLPLDDLLAELWNSDPTLLDLPLLFAIFERFPEDDGAGVLWSIIHGVEALPFDYEAELKASLERQESEMGRILWDRLQRAKPEG